MHGQFTREMPEKLHEDRTWQLLSEIDLRIGTETLLCAAQEQAIRTNYVRHHNDKTSESPLCRLCGEKVKVHLVSGCEKLAQREYKRRQDNVARKVHWHLCKKDRLEHTEKCYGHIPEGAVENEEVKVLWHINVQCDNVIEAIRPDIILIANKKRQGIIIDIAVPVDARVAEKERKKVEKYQNLKREIGRLWGLKMVDVVPVVIEAFVVSQKNLMGGLKSDR